VYPLRVPALRERGRDVLLLAGYFLEENRARLGLRSLRPAMRKKPCWPTTGRATYVSLNT
jgi:transcriptional regulator with GAF, ATPase, and Fis domain